MYHNAPMIAAYVTGHGFGHATRTAEVLREVRRAAPAARLTVVSTAPARLFQRAAGDVEVRPVTCDVGLAQKDALTIDEPGTVEAWRRFSATWDERVHAEARWLREAGASVVLADVPPLAFAAAAQAGVPAIGLTNFSWDWVYAHLAVREPALAEAAAQAAASYAQARLLLELPFAGDLSAFPRREPIPLVARRPRVPQAEARQRLGLGDRPVVLVSFGGFGFPGLRAEALAGLSGFDVVVSDPVEGAPAHVHTFTAGALEARSLGYEDVVGAADVVVTKPGYGIVSDAIAARTRIVYTERGDFPEYPVLVSEMAAHVPAVYVSNQDLRAGRLHAPLERVMALPFPPAPDLGGAAVAARRLLEAASS